MWSLAPPVACRSIEDNENAFPDLQRLCQILAVSNEKHIAALDDFLVALGCDSVDDLVLLEEEHFQDASIPPMIRKKLLLVKEFLLQGDSLEDGRCIHEEILSSQFVPMLQASLLPRKVSTRPRTS